MGELQASVVLIVALPLQNMSEGLAVGVVFGSGDVANALSLMLAIGSRTSPRGSRSRSPPTMRASTASSTRCRPASAGLVEIPLAILGAAAVTLAMAILPYAMGFAAGGMLFVIFDEINRETHVRGHERAATAGT